MLTIRLQRTGRKHEPTFRVVLTDSKNGPKSGKYLENLGWYDSRLENKPEQIDTEKVKYWMSKGAKLSETLHNYFVHNKIITGKKVNVLPKKSPIKKEVTEGEVAAAAPVAEATSKDTAAPAAPAEKETAPEAEQKPVEEKPSSEAKA